MFEPGQSGNPKGRPKGSYGGRIQALASLDRLLARKKNQTALVRALERELQKDPVRFFKTIIMPLLPRESKLSFDHDGVVQWRSLLGVSAEQRAEGGNLRPELATRAGGKEGAACLEAEVVEGPDGLGRGERVERDEQ